jgi:carboxypeptidase Q
MSTLTPRVLLLALAGCAPHDPDALEPALIELDRPDEPALTVEDLQPPRIPVAAGAVSPDVQSLVSLARADRDRIYARLVSLCDGVGHRLAGSPGMQAAIAWGKAGFEADGHGVVRLEPVMVPAWTRGAESLVVTVPRNQPVGMLGLGNSVGTGGEPLEAEVVVAESFEALGPHVAGRIVLFDVPMGTTPPMIQHYGAAVRYRGGGASAAAKHGAVGVLVRSVTSRSLYTPHTGALRYDPAAPKIPAAAITPEDAGWIHRLVDAGQTVRVRLTMEAEMAAEEVEEHNVIAEIRGAEAPEEVVVIGGHLDSWDVGQGAHDDGAGIVEVMEAMRLMASLGKPPRRTIRAVLFANEENGLRGGRGYAAAHADETHVAAIESDLGGGWPVSWAASGTEDQLAWVREAASPIGMPVSQGGGGADISPLRDGGVLLIGLHPDDTHYFDVHHTDADTVDKVDPDALAEATGALAALTWRLANLPDAPAPQPVAPDAPAP